MQNTTAMPDGEKTNIEVSLAVWRELRGRQREPGETFDDVLRRLTGLDETDGGMADGTPDVALPDELPQSVNEDEARAAIAATLEEIDGEPMKFTAIAEAVSRDHPLGYGAACEQRDGAWWSRVVKPGIKANGAEHHRGRGWAV
jgi:hypothetical protein